MHSSVFGMHVHLGSFGQLSQSGRSESKTQASQTKISALWAFHWGTRLFLAEALRSFAKHLDINRSLNIFTHSLSKCLFNLKNHSL